MRETLDKLWLTTLLLVTLMIPAACFCCRYVMKPVFSALVCACTSKGSRPQGSANNIQCSFGTYIRNKMVIWNVILFWILFIGVTKRKTVFYGKSYTTNGPGKLGKRLFYILARNQLSFFFPLFFEGKKYLAPSGAKRRHFWHFFKDKWVPIALKFLNFIKNGENVFWVELISSPVELARVS